MTALRSFSTAKYARRSDKKVDVIKISAFRRIYFIQPRDFFLNIFIIIYSKKYFNVTYEKVLQPRKSYYFFYTGEEVGVSGKRFV